MILSTIAALTFIIGWLAVRSMAGWLVVSDALLPADAIVIMMGPVPDRALQAKSLYEQGLSRKIIFTNEFQPGADQLKDFDIQLETTADVFRKALLKLGVPDSAIMMLPDVSSSTQEEALFICRHAQKHPDLGSLIVVTSSYHSRRTRSIYHAINQAMPKKLHIAISPNQHTLYKVPDWWNDRTTAKLMILEYIKLTHFQLIERWKLGAQIKTLLQE